MAARTMVRHLVNLFYPLHCHVCRIPLGAHEELGLCGSCLNAMRPAPWPRCPICAAPVDRTDDCCAACRARRPAFHRVDAAFVYEGPVRELIHLYKYGRRTGPGRTLDELTAAFASANGILDGIDSIAFVPMHGWRLRRRGFNQSEAIAASLARRSGISLAGVLTKCRRTRAQNELAREERLVNLTGAFTARSGERVAGGSVLLVDDVMTTGATLDACAAALRAAGARTVKCLVVARSIEHRSR